MKKLMLGNEAIARGAYEAGVTVAVAYPGTPSTEITEFIAKYDEIYAEWAPNEKVALEVAIGSSVAGARSVVAMKHVGLNVAADPLFTVSYTGVNAGLVLFVADDPGMHSSQNEQDTRMIAKAANVPVLEPSDSEECKVFVKKAMEISEAYDTPVIVRPTTRVSHSQGIVEIGEREAVELKPYVKDIRKYVMTPANARPKHIMVEERNLRLAEDADQLGLCHVEKADSKVGIITSGICYQYVKEAGLTANILKLDMVNPLPTEVIKNFANEVEELYIVEELEPVIEEQVRALGFNAKGKELFGRQGEISVRQIKVAFGLEVPTVRAAEKLPVRPPVLCPGCPHRGVYTILNKLNLIVTGDIGCYTLGSAPPHGAMDTCVCMGASIGMAHGMEKARGREFSKNVVAIIGDSTFMHSGLTGLVDIVYNKGVSTVIIADNSITGMTGHQHNPATGRTLKNEMTYAVDIPALCKAIGVPNVVTVDAYDMKAVEKALKEETAKEEPSVIITKAPCKLIIKEKWANFDINDETCIKCGMCLKLGCPAICKGEEGISINTALCAGCGLCASVCPKQAISKEVK
ncbi:indolepyruvate ferredoxin oxidoreductase subunit alpha [Cellulosilyticum lentocellum]|uniref:Indolepyruvate oxidoreductase subunit IorA n=1 Tax=Cellulosilyticum lentocellum (strain ATCC 49066 / DSM 5427 / NCIMB 11756 / RHM5) TaxID=642492 RepID=F2JH96_CELLD|nr:indolepyruvate ferredoxin oxidoreductase subunit alpha [Cellulosilyticum lentocellum]ADZ82994.1 indolepyruvate ferredoxin oxidoreductase, alpha subunit [Cellulosilyticum lentocellum DSM 5427]